MKVVLFKQKQGCTPCNTLTDFLVSVGVDFNQPELEVVYLDEPTEEGLELASKHMVMSTPTTMLIDDEGEEVTRAVGDNRPHVMAILNGMNLV